jgi:hypothetical protein
MPVDASAALARGPLTASSASACRRPNAGPARFGKRHTLAPTPLPQPTEAPESASGRCANSASAQTAGSLSASRQERQPARLPPSSVLLALAGRKTDVIGYGQAKSCRLAERTQKCVFGIQPDTRCWGLWPRGNRCNLYELRDPSDRRNSPRAVVP